MSRHPTGLKIKPTNPFFVVVVVAKKVKLQGWRDCSVIKSACCSSNLVPKIQAQGTQHCLLNSKGICTYICVCVLMFACTHTHLKLKIPWFISIFWYKQLSLQNGLKLSCDSQGYANVSDGGTEMHSVLNKPHKYIPQNLEKGSIWFKSMNRCTNKRMNGNPVSEAQSYTALPLR